ncbi:MAG: hypothetical protein RSB25_19670 [Acinetobacter sp.]
MNTESVQALFELANNEYEHELNRISSIDTKVSITLPIVSALLLAVASQCQIAQIIDIPDTACWTVIRCILLSLLYVGALALSSLSLVWTVQCIWPRQYLTLEVGYFYDEQLINETPDVIKTMAANRIIEAITRNKQVNETRMKKYAKGCNSAAIAIGCYVVYSILNTL